MKNSIYLFITINLGKKIKRNNLNFSQLIKMLYYITNMHNKFNFDINIHRLFEINDNLWINFKI